LAAPSIVANVDKELGAAVVLGVAITIVAATMALVGLALPFVVALTLPVTRATVILG
jgi:hypothetical protein